MPVQHWAAPAEVVDLLLEVKEAHPHLQQATFAVEFADSKPFIKDRLNLGKLAKFSKSAKLWHAKDKKYDFHVSLCADVWYSVFKAAQHKPLIDLHLSRIKAEYEPEVVEVNGKKEKVKDEWGRITYTNQMKHDDEGRPIWTVTPLDIKTITENISRFGLWYDELAILKEAVAAKPQ